MEARLITPAGFSISIATERIENPGGGKHDKQDCERKGFARLAAKLKEAHPRLPIVMLADGLYPYESFFATCKVNQWAYRATFEDGDLPTVWEEVRGLQPLQNQNTRQEACHRPDGKTVGQVFRWVADVDYQGHALNWPECKETIRPTKLRASEGRPKTTRFVHITDFPISARNVADTSKTGALDGYTLRPEKLLRP